MKNHRLLRSLYFFVLLSVLARPAFAQDYNLEGPAWPAGSHVVIKLGLGSTNIGLQDGSASWNASATDALDIWDGYVDFITLSPVSSSTVAQASGDAINSVFFSSTILGDDFGNGTLAVTILLSDDSETRATEADVIVNTAYHYDSYRGPLQASAPDLHRILMHEFGHVLGLDHVFHSPTGREIMEPEISDLDHPAGGDIVGIRQLYGASYYLPPGNVTLRIGYSFFDELLPNNEPTSFTSTGLPPGITLDDTGRFDGKPTASGDYAAVVTAHGPLVDVSEGYHFKILGLEELPGLVSILPLEASSIVADPIRPRVYVAGTNGIDMIDTTTLASTNILPGFVPNAALSISADGSTLLETQRFGSPAQELRIDLETLSPLAPLPIPADGSAVLEGLNGQAYVAGLDKIHQFNASTGELQSSFAQSSPDAVNPAGIAISPDRKTLYVSRSGSGGELSSYDISGAEPMLLHHLTGSFTSATSSRDGQFLYYVEALAGGSSVVRAPVPDLAPATAFASGPYLGPTAEALDGRIFQSIFPASGGVYDPSGFYSVFDPVLLEDIAAIPLGNLQDYYPYYPLDIAFDSTGGYLFAIVLSPSFGQEVWVLSTDFASLPPPVHATKNLLNISTRLQVASGENAMIGGFIIQGSEPKKVLVRGLGPSLPITGALSNPVLELYDSTGWLLASNDDWKSDELNILSSQIVPSSERESAIQMTLGPGAYTAIVRDATNQPGLALVEVYDLDPKHSAAANISTRGRVATGDDVMIGGFIIGGEESTRVLVRALGPSLAALGIALPLSDPVLEIHDSTGTLIFTNDNWRSTQQAEIVATGLPPSDDKESAAFLTLVPGGYTAIVRGQNSTTGVALVEVYNLDAGSTGSK